MKIEPSAVKLFHFYQVCIVSGRAIIYVPSSFPVSPLAVQVGRLLRKEVIKIKNEGEII